jgi:hypothetical protein
MKIYSLILLLISLSSCSSFFEINKANESLGAKHTIYGEWELVTEKDFCKKKLIIELQPDKSAVVIKDLDNNGWVLPFKARDIRTSLDKYCGETKIDHTGTLTRDCSGDFKSSGKNLKGNLNWKIIPVGADGLDYTFINFQKMANNCQYARAGLVRPVPPPVADLPRVFDLPPGTMIKSEPRKPLLTSNEKFEYKEISRKSYGKNVIGKHTEDLSNLSNRPLKLETIIAPMKLVFKRKMEPCFTIGEGREDPTRCNAVIFDKAVLGKRFYRDVQVGVGASQDPQIKLQGNLDINLDDKDNLNFSVRNVPENLIVGLTAYTTSTKKVFIKMERPTKELMNLSKSLKAVSVSKGIITLESDLTDLSEYLITLKAVRKSANGTNTTILNNLFQVGARFVSQTVINDKAVVSIDIKEAINDIGKEQFITGQVHDFEVSIDLKEKHRRSMKDYAIIKSVKGISFGPVFKGIYNVKVD